jgi:hypothetical protein
MEVVGGMQAAMTALRAAHDAVATLPVDHLTAAEIVGVLDDLETLTCQLPVQWHRLLTRWQAETTPKALGAKSWREVMAVRWRISPSEAGRRLEEAGLLASRQTLIGAPLDPVMPCTAIAQSHGLVNREHVHVLAEAMSRVPAAVDPTTRGQIEADLVTTAMSVGPKQLKDTADRTIFLLDQDGPEPEDTERARRRGATKGPQQPDGMVRLQANLTPEAWAVFEAVFATLAAPGMCNPDDEHPCVSGTPTQAQIDGDHRTLAQRQHDALLTAGRRMLDSGELGRHNGLPATIVIRTTLQDLESRAGVGVTGGGTVMPIRDVIGLAGRANLFLAVFDGATGSALNLFRARRTASPAQRLMLIARDGGCTKPVCTVPAYGCQVHHATADWAAGGQTNVDDLALACGPDNRMVGPGGWSTRVNADHDVEWLPPPSLDTGQARVNGYHRPERLFRPPDAEPDTPSAEDDLRPGGPEPNAA